MKVFLSWSGPRSHAVAKVFADWLPTVLTASKPWISSEDIEKGATWITSIKDALSESKGLGIFFATRESQGSSWLNFEAGAIASLGSQRVCVLCIDLEPGELNAPLSLFQSTRIDRDDVFKLLRTLNGQLAEPASDVVLTKIFGRSWDELAVAIQAAVNETEKTSRKAKKPTIEQSLVDIASALQRLESRLSTLERSTFRGSTPNEGGPALDELLDFLIRSNGALNGSDHSLIANYVRRKYILGENKKRPDLTEFWLDDQGRKMSDGENLPDRDPEIGR